MSFLLYCNDFLVGFNIDFKTAEPSFGPVPIWPPALNSLKTQGATTAYNLRTMMSLSVDFTGDEAVFRDSRNDAAGHHLH
jgi:hypothetical protein